MCTATYLPLGPTGFILTHSRDEKALRPAARPPQIVIINGQEVMFPQDPQGQGTWIAASAQTAVCLLNGAFSPHPHRPPYRHSRGLVIPHFFGFQSTDDFINHYTFDHIEPFTLLILRAGQLVELRWNGQRLFIHEKDALRPHIWSSVTLYTPDVIEKREQWFAAWLASHASPSVAAIRAFHTSAGDGDPQNDINMNRQGETLTLSLTSIVHDSRSTEIIYEDFTQHTLIQQTIQRPYATA